MDGEKGILYRMEDCGHCQQAVELLGAMGVSERVFELRIAHTDDQGGKRIWGEILKLVGRLTVPVLVFPDGSFLAYPPPGEDAEQNPEEDENRRWTGFARNLATAICDRSISSVKCH